MPLAPNFILTKIIATIGPACHDPAVLVRLIEEGVRVVRLNFSHGTLTDFDRSLAAIREASERTQTPVGVLGDLSGPKIRLGKIQGGTLMLEAGDRVEFTPDEQPGRRERLGEGGRGAVVLSVNYPPLVDEVKPGQRVLIDDGAVRMLAVESGSAQQAGQRGRRVICRATGPGMISDHKGVNLPDTELSAPSLTAWDKECAAWAVGRGLDFLALSFVREAKDVQALTGYLRSLGGAEASGMPIVAKIEKPQAVQAIESIVEAADAVMVARGDLGVEMDPARVPVIQKRLIQRCHDFGKPVIVATQMLQSMIDAPTATRAEVSDVANAILDGADAVMLSGETAVGRYPVQAVHTMNRTAAIAEAYGFEVRGPVAQPPRKLQGSRYRTAALAHGVSTVVKDLGARFVVVWSELGGGARYLSQNRLSVPILAVSSNAAALRRMGLLFGVRPVLMPRPSGPQAFAQAVDRLLLDNPWAKRGDAVVLVGGQPLGTPGVTNALGIHYVGGVCPVQDDRE